MIRWDLNLWGRFIQQTVLRQLASHLENLPSRVSKCLNVVTDFNLKIKPLYSYGMVEIFKA